MNDSPRIFSISAQEKLSHSTSDDIGTYYHLGSIYFAISRVAENLGFYYGGSYEENTFKLTEIETEAMLAYGLYRLRQSRLAEKGFYFVSHGQAESEEVTKMLSVWLTISPLQLWTELKA